MAVDDLIPVRRQTTRLLLEILARSSYGMTTYNVLDKFSEIDPESRGEGLVKVVISGLVKDGLLRSENDCTCKECGKRSTLYYITEQGRLHLIHRYGGLTQ